MTKILFVCHGNICRSPMAEYFMKELVRREGLEKMFEIASAATSIMFSVRDARRAGSRGRILTSTTL